MHWQLAATLSRAPITDKPARALPPLLFFTDAVRTPDPVSAIAGLPKGCGVVFRHYESPDRIRLAKQCRLIAKDQNRLFLIAGDDTLAHDIRADGVHLPDHLAHNAQRIRQRHPNGTITLAVHNARALRKAQSFDVDALMASPIFPTQSHPTRPSFGPLRLAGWTRASRHPLYALGGVTRQTIMSLKGTGVYGIAAIGGLLPQSA